MSAPGSGEVPPARRRRGPVDRRLVVRLGSARLGVAAGVGLGLVATAAVVVQAVLLAHLLAAMAPRHVPSHLVAALAGLAATALVRALAAALGELAGRDGAERVKRSLRRELLLASLGRPLAGGRAACPPAATGPGSLAVLAGPGLDALDAYVARCLPDLVLGVVAPVALLVAVGLIDWPSALVVAVALGLFPLFGVLVGRSTSTLARRRLGQVAELSDRLVDLFVGLPVLRCLGRAGEQRASLAAAGESLRRSSMAALRVAFLSALVLDTLASISTALVAVPLGLRLIWGSAHLAPALAVLVVAPEVYLPLRRASAEFHESAAGLAAAGKVLDALGDPAGRPAALPAGVGGAPLRAAGRRERSLGRVELRGVTLEWAASPHPVLAGVDLEVAPGE
ncbi:MAG TPA: ABC transporter transmembrane domain-containing protein, partial [Acidimicrobiales bacterium]|nr:ABC transporter transmembrane domain-containing protein [Acidimicrobiales bacterium]